MLTPTTEGPNAAPQPSTIQRTSQLPASDVALSALATKAAEAWTTSALPPLLWLSKAEFTTLAAAYAQGRDAADAAGDQRTPQSQRLQQLDKLLDKHLRYVKGYLAEAHDEDEGRSYYPEFGITRENKAYSLPRARAERVKALNKLLLALVNHNLDKQKYGTAFWQPLAQEYTQLVQASTESAGQRSAKVSNKDQHEAQVRRALRALIHHLKANYPDTYQAQLRAFGFQKESY
ncbi:hypothetical protein KLP40_07295 [Hymenobacter sp. NST-14]|uniref:hypothetical protein n=1 Tax=Hymenobacter piscis TaxID=2839984 RepID=UPI001C02A252|nr:hypothetical protein [Hymenobacter piscis]MBT9392962.1 hypothetical protein [Hymenobacter piscis]